jgi:hypothetical protein
MLSILDLHEQLDAAGVVLPQPVGQHNTAGRIRREHGISLLAATVAAARLLHHIADRGGHPDERLAGTTGSPPAGAAPGLSRPVCPAIGQHSGVARR